MIKDIDKIKHILEHDGVIACVTDTVWGLACLPQSEIAVKKIYEIKKREAKKPLILMSDEFYNLFDFVKLTKEVLSDNPLFVLISSYTTGLQASVLSNILTLVFGEGGIDADEIVLPTKEKIVLPCGARGLKLWKN